MSPYNVAYQNHKKFFLMILLATLLISIQTPKKANQASASITVHKKFKFKHFYPSQIVRFFYHRNNIYSKNAILDFYTDNRKNKGMSLLNSCLVFLFYFFLMNSPPFFSTNSTTSVLVQNGGSL